MSKKFLAFLVLMMPLTSWSESRYVVQPGDTILKIADRTLGNTDRNNTERYKLAKKIQQMNPGLKNPNALEPGQTLLIPGSLSKASAKEVSHTPAPEPTHAEAVVASKPAEPIPAPTPVSLPEPAEAQHSPGSENYTVKVHSADKHAATGHALETKSHEGGHSNFFFVQPRYQLLKITAKDLATKNKVSMKSKSSIGLDLQYGKILNDYFHLLFQAGVTHTQFDKIEGDSATINHDAETLKSLAAGIAWEATSKLHLDLMFMAAERTFIVPKTHPTYELKAVMVPGAELNISYDLYSGTSNILGVSAIGEYLATATKDSVEYKSALESLGAIYWKSKFGHDRVNYKVTVTYKKGHQDTSLTEQHEDVTALGIGFYF